MRGMVLILPWGSECPSTDKGSMIRDEVYRQYADEISGIYTVVKRSRDALLELSVSETKAYLVKLCSED